MKHPLPGSYARLTAGALVVPETTDWSPRVLGAGSIVRLATTRAVSPVTTRTDEPYVFWSDNIGRQSLGWLASNTILQSAEKHVTSLAYCGSDDQTRLAPLDRLRSLVMGETREDESVTEPWSIASWCRSFGGEQLDALRDVIRELGGRVAKDASEQNIIDQTLRLIYGKEIPMAEVATKTPRAKSAGKSGAKKSAAKKSTGETSAPARSMARTASVAAVSALEKAGATNKLVALAKRLEKGELGKKELLELRDGVNTAASEARTNNKPAVATALSSANRLIRRIARKS